MAKDPAVLFYTSDFLSGTYTMNNEQVGKYIKLLCLQHQKDGVSETELKSISENDELVMEKFTLIEGRYYNVRMRDEAIKRKKYSESRSKNRTKKENVDMNHISKSYEKHMNNISSTYDEHMENENENVNVIKNINESSSINPKLVEKILDKILQYDNTKIHREAVEDLLEIGSIDEISNIMGWDSIVKENYIRAINQHIQIHNDK